MVRRADVPTDAFRLGSGLRGIRCGLAQAQEIFHGHAAGAGRRVLLQYLGVALPALRPAALGVRLVFVRRRVGGLRFRPTIQVGCRGLADERWPVRSCRRVRVRGVIFLLDSTMCVGRRTAFSGSEPVVKVFDLRKKARGVLLHFSRPGSTAFFVSNQVAISSALALLDRLWAVAAILDMPGQEEGLYALVV